MFGQSQCFQGLLLLDTGFALVTAVWVGDTQPPALLQEAGHSALCCCTAPCCPDRH